uniref:Pentacotripeptide-repeat region of PRORP domain-containing protein n=1 Tax=Eutreptiella gymnastica TaxID=73025 RepID=A0A7S1NR45_9EUGL
MSVSSVQPTYMSLTHVCPSKTSKAKRLLLLGIGVVAATLTMMSSTIAQSVTLLVPPLSMTTSTSASGAPLTSVVTQASRWSDLSMQKIHAHTTSVPFDSTLSHNVEHWTSTTPTSAPTTRAKLQLSAWFAMVLPLGVFALITHWWRNRQQGAHVPTHDTAIAMMTFVSRRPELQTDDDDEEANTPEGRRRRFQLTEGCQKLVRLIREFNAHNTTCSACATAFVEKSCTYVDEFVEEFNAAHKEKNLRKLETNMEVMLSEGHRPTPRMYLQIMNIYGQLGLFPEADAVLQALFEDEAQFMDAPMFNAVIHGWCMGSMVEEALDVLRQMKARGVRPNRATYGGSFKRNPKRKFRGDASLVSMSAELGNPRLALDVLRDAEIQGVKDRQQLIDLYNSAVRGFCRVKRLTEARSIIRCLHNEELDMELVGSRQFVLRPNAMTYGPLINAYCDLNMSEDARALLSSMQSRGIKPTTAIFNMLLKCFARNNNIIGAQAIFREMCGSGFWDMSKIGVRPDTVTYTTLMEMAARNGDMTSVQGLFQQMKDSQLPLDVIVYAQLIRAYSSEYRPDLAEQALEEMVASGIKANVIIYTSLITAYCLCGAIDDAERVFRDMEAAGITPNQRTFRSLFKGYNSAGRGVSWEVVQRMKELKIPVSQDLLYYIS